MVPLSFCGRDALLFAGHDVERHDRQDGAVHGHGDGHLVERNLAEEDLHVLDRIDGHAGFADVAHHAFVVGIVAAMGGQIEGHRQAFLTSGEVAPVEGVRFFGGGEAGVLADGPGLHGVHGGVRAAQEGRNPGGVFQVLHRVEVVGGVMALDRNSLMGHPRRGVVVGGGRAGGRGRQFKLDFGEVRFHALFLHPQPVLPVSQGLDGVAHHVHKTLDAGCLESIHLVLWDFRQRSPAPWREDRRPAQMPDTPDRNCRGRQIGSRFRHSLQIPQSQSPRSQRNSERIGRAPCAFSNRRASAEGPAERVPSG